MSPSRISSADSEMAIDERLSIVNPCPTRLDGPELLHDLVSGPEVKADALDYLDADGQRSRYTYAALHRRSARLAHHLRRLPGSKTSKQRIVPLLIPQCPALYISQLAILKSGAAFCPLNLDVPEERLRFILQDVQAQVVITTSDLQEKFSACEDIRVVIVDERDALGGAEDSMDELDLTDDQAPKPEDLAYVMYTSGSTGLPKAVSLPHSAVTQALLGHDRHIPQFSRFLQFASPTFDVSVFEIFFPLFRGKILVACDRKRLLSDLPGTITELDVDAAELTPSVAASLVRRRENVPSLKVLLTIGEMLNAPVVKEFGGSVDRPAMLYGMYGPTEAAIHCTIQPAFDSDLPNGTIGIPLDTVSCYIVKPAASADEAGEIEVLPRGEAGELVVGGHQLADGYLNREEQTKAVFISHPKYGPLYRTGDRAKLRSDGLMECLGRISSGQVKLRGQRIELGEIEQAASKTPGCHAVVASVISGLLVLFCVVTSRDITVNRVKHVCRKWLPSFMVPSDVVLLDDFPYLPSGKVDKKKLERDYTDNMDEGLASEETLSEQSQKLLAALRDVLQVKVQPSTNFATAGLDSLRAIQLASELRKQQLAEVGALELLETETLQDLESLIRLRQTNEKSSQSGLVLQKLCDTIMSSVLQEPYIAQRQDDIDHVLPCTPVQDAMLFETFRTPQAYCNWITLSFPANFNGTDVQKLFRDVAKKHALLRTGFCNADSSTSAYAQIIWKDLTNTQVFEAKELNYSFSLQELHELLHPLRVQYRHTEQATEVLLQLHHALYDQWSLEILVEDLNSLARKERSTERPQFRNVVEYYTQLGQLSETHPPSLEFWEDYMSGASSSRLPNLTGVETPPGPLAITHRTMELDMRTLNQCAQSIGCSPHVLFQSTFAYLISLYNGTDDVTFGTVYSGRTSPIAGIEDIIGPILATLPSRANVSETRTFKDLARLLHNRNRGAMKHVTVPLADVKRACGLSPVDVLFDSIFVWQETSRTQHAGETPIKLLETGDFLEFNLTLEVEPLENSAQAKATFQPSVIPHEQVDLLLAQVEHIVKLVVRNPDCPTKDLCACLPPPQLSMANTRPVYYPFGTSLAGLIQRHAEERPDSPAIAFARHLDDIEGDIQLMTYKELNERANKLANHILSSGVKPDDLVCICMEKSMDLYISILATVKSGAAYLPLVPETPEGRIRQILNDGHVKLCLGDARSSQTLSKLGSWHVIDVPSADLSAFSSNIPEVGFQPSDLLYAVYTSGTTGTPKGVMVTQENLLSNLVVLEKIYPVPAGSRLLQACNQAFDVSVFEIFFSWYKGICLCSATKDVLFRDLEQAIRQMQITHLSLTSTVAALVDPVNVPNVKFLVTAGEPVTQHVHQAWAGKGFYNGYGPSETTNICTVNPAVQSHHLTSNVGPPFENTSVFVLSASTDFDLVPIGGLGELCFGGQQVFRGYQGMSELTQSKIIEHPEYGRIYRSGDLGRLLHSGSIVIEGRIDDQRKLRGQRIELGEIASLLLKCSDVNDCTIQILERSGFEETLVAFWKPANQPTTDYKIVDLDERSSKTIQHLFEELANQLPAYMLPSALIPITAIPRTSQGKIDRRRLAADFAGMDAERLDSYSQGQGQEQDAGELSESEQRLAGALAETLKAPVSSIRRGTSFFSLGLDSVSAIRFSRMIKLETGCQVDVSVILKSPTIARLAAFIARVQRPSEHSRAENIHGLKQFLPNGVRSAIIDEFATHGKKVASILPCTPLQEAMLSATSSGTSLAYLNKTCFKINGNVVRLRQCWLEMVKRHGILRTAFAPTDDAKHPFVQVVLDRFELPWHSSTRQLHTLDAEYEPPYSLALRPSEGITHLELTMHHALYDANAMSNLLREIEDFYGGARLLTPVSFEPFLEHMLASNIEEASYFFNEHLRGYTPKPLLSEKQSAAAGNDVSGGFGVVRKDLSVSRSDIDTYLRRQSASMLALCQAAWAKVISLCQGFSDVCIGNVVSGRSVPVENIENLVAPCFNTIPVRVDLLKCQNNLGLIKALQRSNAQALPYQLTPLRRIQREASPLGHRLFESLVLLQQPQRSLNSSIWSLESEAGEMNFPLICEINPSEDTISFSLHFDRALFASQDIIVAVVDAFEAAFFSCLRYPSSDASDFVDFAKDRLANRLRPDELYMEEAVAAIYKRQDNAADQTWSPVELEIRDAFSALSGAKRASIARNTTIYRIGLDSISAIQVAGRLRKKGFDLDASDVLENPTCSGLASVAQSRMQTPEKNTPAFDFEAFDHQHRAQICSSFNIKGSNIEAIRPSTQMQAGMISQFLQSQGDQYFNHIFYKLDAGITAEQLRHAWLSTARNHEMLRTGFTHLEDVKHPYAMVTYKPSAVHPSWFEITQITKEAAHLSDLQESAMNDVLESLHRPVWRFRVVESEEERCMQFSAHHAIYDAETLRMILHDLYAALRSEPISRRSAIDGALSYVLSNSSDRREAQEDFWTEQLKSASVTRFPNLNPVRVTDRRNLTADRTCELHLSQFQKHCREAGVSVQAAGQAAWAQILAAYTGEPLVTFGVVFSGRSVSETSAAPFPCITTVPLSCNTAEQSTKLLHKLMSSNAKILKHQFTPLTDIQRYAGFPNEALFDTLFAYQKPVGSYPSEQPFKIIHEQATVDCAVSIELEHLPMDRLGLRLTFNTALLPEGQANTLLVQMESLLMEMILPDAGYKTQSENFSLVPAKEPELPTEVQLLHQLVETIAQRHPDRVALQFVSALQGTEITSRNWTYKQLNEEGNRVAHLLQDYGTKPGDTIAICLDKCPEASFAFLGILKAGCAFLAIDPAAPVARKAFILQDSKSRMLLSSGAIIEDLAAHAQVGMVDLPGGTLGKLPSTPVPDLDISPASVSYVLYTSGTTGTPKGCELTHDNAVQALLAFQRLFSGRWDQDSRWLQFASYHFDVAVLEHFWSWSVGIRLVCAPRDLVLEDLMGMIDALRITHIDLTPSLGRLLDPEMVPSLHRGVFITGGEAVKQEILDAWGSIGSLFNFYGPTECTIGVTTFPSMPDVGKPSNIGWQFDNVGSVVLDPQTQQPVFRGGVGELCIFGRLVGKGYLNRPDLTNERFPYLENIGERVYRTGDLVRLLHDGSFDFLGRIDTQVKLRGQRLELDEIDTVIRDCEGIGDVVSLVTKHPKQQKDQLISFIASSSRRTHGKPELGSSDEARKSIDAARAACEESLPGYMVPTHFVPVRYIPLSVNNKVEEKVLRGLYEELSVGQLQDYAGEASSEAPFSDSEQVISAALGALLHVDTGTLGPETNVFALGLSSISAIQFAQQLKKRGFHQAQPAMVMRNPTIRRLAKAISAVSMSESGEVTAAKQTIAACHQRHLSNTTKQLSCLPEDIEAVAPCTALQQGILYRSLSSESSLYFNSFLYSLNKVDCGKLKNAFQDLINNTQILRTVFLETDEGYIQAVRASAHLLWLDCNIPEGEDNETVLAERKSKWAASNRPNVTTPFEVVHAQGPSCSILEIHIHHALYDGNSWQLLLENVAQIYDGKDQANPGGSFVQSLPYGPLRTTAGAKDFWTQHLAHSKPKLMPSLIEKPAARDNVHTATLEGLAAVDEVRRALNVTLQALVQAAWLAVLRKYYEGALGVVVSGRSIDYEGAENLIGPLFNTVPFDLHPSPDQSWQDLVKQCHEYNVLALPFQHTPLRDISKWCKRSPSEPLFDTLFVFQGQLGGHSRADELFVPIEDDSFQADYPLSFEVGEDAEQNLKVTVAAKGDICDTRKAEDLIAEFRDAFSAIILSPQSSIGRTVAIPEPGSNANEQPKTHQADVNGVEDFEWTAEASVVRQEVAHISGIAEEDVDEHVSIFQLGLDSVDAVRLSSRLKKKCLQVSVSSIMKAKTIPKILKASKTMRASGSASSEVSFLKNLSRKLAAVVKNSVSEAENIECVLPASPMQEALVGEMLNSSFHRYFNHDVLSLSEDTDAERLKTAWRDVIEASPILRTAFCQVEDPDLDLTFAQVITKPASSCLVDLHLESEDAIQGYMEDVRQDMAFAAPLTPPFRISFLTTGANRYMIVSLAHALYDGYSLGLLHTDVRDAYNNRSVHRPSYDSVLESAMQTSTNDADSFWRTMLSGAKRTPFPQSHAANNAEITTHREERISTVSAETVTKFCRKQGITVQTLCQTSWALTLAHYTQTLDVLFGIVLSGRDSPEAQEVMFPTMNSVIMRSVIHGSRREMLQYTQKTVGDIMQYQQTPLRRIQAICPVQRNTPDGADPAKASSSNALFDTLFTYQKDPADDHEQENLLYESINGSSDVEFPVAVEAEIVADKLVWRTACKNTVFDAEGASKLLQHLDLVVDKIVNEPGSPSLEFTQQVISICGLPAFPRKEPRSSENVDTGTGDSRKKDESVQALSPIELEIRSVVAKVTKTPEQQVSKNSAFQNLGVDSINAIKISALLRKSSIRLTVSEILRAGSIGKLTASVGTSKSAATDSESPDQTILAILAQKDLTAEKLGYDPTNVETVMPATSGQIYMLSMWQVSRGQLFFPEFKYVLKGSRDLDAVRNAWNRLVSQHAILRTVFAPTPDVDIPFVQIVLRRTQDSFVAISRHQDGVTGELHQPLVQLRAEQVDGCVRLGLKIHHALYDAVSLPLLMHDLESHCRGANAPSPERSFVDFLAPSYRGDSKSRVRDFWTKYLSGAKPSQLAPPTSVDRRRVEHFNPAVMKIDQNTEAIMRKQGLTIQALFFAAYAKVYASLVGNAPREVVLGIYLANRSHLDDLSSLAAPTLNLVPLQIVEPLKSDTATLAKRIQADLQEISSPENSGVGLWEIARWTGVKVDTFVNFLKLPGRDEIDEEERRDVVVIEEVDDGRASERRSLMHEPSGEAVASPGPLRSNIVKDVYKFSLDIEATVADGALAIGVFGWESMLGLEEAEGVVKDLAGVLREGFMA